MTSEVIYVGGLRTEATHLKSGQQIITDAPPDNQGKGEAFSPTDLVATGLASCILTIIGIRARDLGIDIEGAKALVNKIMDSDPRRISEVEVTIYMPQKSFTQKDKLLLERATSECPVCRSLNIDLQQCCTVVWPEDQ